MTEFAPIAPDKLKKQKPTRSIQPRQRLSLRTVNFLDRRSKDSTPLQIYAMRTTIFPLRSAVLREISASCGLIQGIVLLLLSE